MSRVYAWTNRLAAGIALGLCIVSARLHAADTPLLFSDDFATLRPGWGKAGEVESTSHNKLIVKPLPKTARTTLYQDTVAGNVDIRLKVSQIKGGSSQAGGIVFWAIDYGNCYAALLQSDGLFMVARKVNSQWLRPVSPKIRDEVLKGLGQVNQLRVVTCGRQATVYINDKRIVEFKGFPPQGGGRFGMHSESGAEPSLWAYSALRVRKGPPTPPSQDPRDESLLLADDFSTLDPAWGAPDEEQSVAGNKLILKPVPNTGRTQLYQGTLVGDADIRLKVSQIKGASDTAGGIAFWGADYRNYYTAIVQSAGQFSVVQRANNKWQRVVPLKVRDEAIKGLGQVDQLRVVTFGKQATIYVNEKQVAAFEGSPPEGGSRFGVYAESGAEPSLWTCSELSVRKGLPTAPTQRPSDDSLLLADDFSTLRPGWGRASESTSVSDNKLILSLNPQRIRSTLRDGTLPGDVDIRLKVSQVKGNTDQPGGIAFWATDHENLYAARVTFDGRFSVGRQIHGRWLSPVSLQVRDEVRKGLGQANELRVVTSGRSVTVYVNDKQVVALAGFPPEGPSKIGVYAESGDDPSTWAFSELSVRKGPSPRESEGQRDDSLLVTDDFATLDPAWGRATETRNVSGGKLTLTLPPRIEHHSFYQGSLFANADIRLKVALTAGELETSQVGGVIFWGLNNTTYYMAVLCSDGDFIVARKIHDKPLYLESKECKEMLKGLGQVNQLRVVTCGNSATVYINDKQAAALKGFPPEGGSLVGVHVESNTKPCTWAVSEFRVRKGLAPPEPQGPRDESLLFADDFSTLDPSWGEANDVKSVSGNKLILKPRPNTTYTTLYRGNLFGDADIRVKMAQTGGNMTVKTDRGTATIIVPSGLIFWAADTDHYYEALINPSGRFFVARYEKGAKPEFQRLVPLEAYDAVQPGVGKVNEIRIVTKGKSGTAYVNSQLIGTFEGSPPEGGGKIGLRAQSGEDRYIWEFSDFVVRKPK